MSYLILVRHGESEYNAKGLWTGWTDIPISEKGRAEARRAGEKLQDIKIDVAFTSPLIRAKQTLEEIKKTLHISNLPTFENKALNERNYGIYTGKNKWEVREKIGEEEFKKLRRGFNYPIPQGESLKQVYERVVPYYQKSILPQLKEGKNVIVSSSGNAIRALVKYLEHLSDDAISNFEIGTGEVHIYQMDREGNILSKEIRATNPDTGKQ